MMDYYFFHYCSIH